MAPRFVVFASFVIIFSMLSHISTCYFVEQILSPKWMSASSDLKNNQQIDNDKKLFKVLENIEMENLPLSNKEQPTINNNIDSYHEYQHSTCQLVQIIHLLNHSGCQAKAISSFACSGSCSSYVQVSNNNY